MSGQILDQMRFHARLAWGNGGVPLCVGPRGRGLLGMGAEGALWGWDLPLGTGGWRTVPEGVEGRSLGIAHMARSGLALLCGFNRDGYRLHRYLLEE